MARSILITDIAHFVGGPSARALIAEGASIYGVDASFTDADARAAFEEKTPGVKTNSTSRWARACRRSRHESRDRQSGRVLSARD